MYGIFGRNTMGYGVWESMGYGFEFPANQLGNSKILWGITEYGFSQVWDKTEATVHRLGQ